MRACLSRSAIRSAICRTATRAGLALLAAAALGQGAAAHPHVFIDAGATLIFDKAGRLTGLRVEWKYDEFYTLAMIDDARLDADGDGVPDPARLAAYAGHDVDWAAGFPGHVSLTQNGKELHLGPPREHRATYHDGHIITTHLRPVTPPVAVGAPLSLRLYDPEYFVAYDTPDMPRIDGRRDCKVQRRLPDTSGQKALLASLMALDSATDSLTVMRMSDVGVTFAETFKVTCGAR